jgi:transcriptional regulator with XRE-family HTH domain
VSKVRTATEVDVFVGARLKSLRKSVGLSQTELANQVGVTFQQIQKYERGTNRIGASRLWSLCQVFDVEPGRFFDGVEEHIAKADKH